MKEIDFNDLRKHLLQTHTESVSEDLLQQIHGMDIHTAYVLLGGYLAPLLNRKKREVILRKVLPEETPIDKNIENPENLEAKIADLQRDKEEIQPQENKKSIKKSQEIELKELKKKQEIQDSYIFMIVVFLTQLHTRQAEKLKVHGETLQKISRIFDQWNKIQQTLNTVAKNGKTILQWVKEKKVDSNYNLFTDNTLTTLESDPAKLAIWNSFKFFISNLHENVKELKRILDEVKKNIPNSAKSLLDTIYKLSEKLLDIPDTKNATDLTSYLRDTTQSEAAIRITKEINQLKTTNKNLLIKADTLTDEMAAIRDDIGETRWNLTDGFLELAWPSYYKKKQEWNQKYNERKEIYDQVDANKKKIQEKESEFTKETRNKPVPPDKRLTILAWISDSDQTKFKSYMDNVAQGITALTSISNMTQQELQIDTQYYNSLLGLQKAGFDSLNQTIQGILANLR